ncbi:glycerophosphodiester phosphodiesterase [Natronosporangium hydrolyticum]|uniref:Glycerophosphodiester phosphodiesterase n=1 Tax=Natronosporangium hydrolyticum TaxID=2811111 RepID=A0A895YRP7_9ACTN|nr:glycerophosphodiester phosphodiesterase [Natronosporangium hydrolyticum]
MAIATGVGVLLAGGVYLHNSSRLTGPSGDPPLLLAHRGLGQTFPFDGITNDTCTAERIFPPEHPYLENTVESIEAAFAAGADVVEVDIQLTRDDRLVVFHDHELECRTDGTGRVRDHTVAQLQALDIGYGYTADGGATFPFRGEGVGLMPTLEEVLTTFADRELLIDVKSADPVEGERLADYLDQLPPAQLELLTVYGGDAPVAALSARLPQVRVLSREMLERCLLRYVAVGWTGRTPVACRNRQLHIPEAYAPWLWGWPHRFVERMERHDTRVILVAGDGGFSEGFDSRADWQRIPAGYSGGVWSNRVDLVAPLREQGQSAAQ